MPTHDWSRVDAGIFHAFHHNWISTISHVLNEGLLPPDYYALPEQHAAGFGPDVLTLQSPESTTQDPTTALSLAPSSAVLLKPALTPTAETDMEFYRRKQDAISVRHVSGDRVVAMIEIVSKGNKSTRHAMRSLVEKAAQLLDRGVHLLLIDLFPSGPRDPQGLHGAIWEEIDGSQQLDQPQSPLTLVAYEAGLLVRAYVRGIHRGEILPEMPLFLEAGACVMVPLESTYAMAFSDMPRRWRAVLDQ